MDFPWCKKNLYMERAGYVGFNWILTFIWNSQRKMKKPVYVPKINILDVLKQFIVMVKQMKIGNNLNFVFRMMMNWIKLHRIMQN